MEITVKWLKERDACKESIEALEAQKERDSRKILDLLITQSKLDWVNWLIVRLMSYRQYVSYAVFAAEQVIGIYEKKHPDDKRPRQAIEAAKKCLKSPTKKNKAAAYAAHAAAYAAHASYAAHAAAHAASYAASYAAYAASYAASYAAYAADAMRKKILDYGIKLLGKEKP